MRTFTVKSKLRVPYIKDFMRAVYFKAGRAIMLKRGERVGIKKSTLNAWGAIFDRGH